MSTNNKRIDWEDINIKAGIAFTIVGIGIAIVAYLLVKVNQ